MRVRIIIAVWLLLAAGTAAAAGERKGPPPPLRVGEPVKLNDAKPAGTLTGWVCWVDKWRFKLRIEAGWGPHPGEIPLPDRHWEGTLSVSGGRIIGWEPCWVTRDQSVPQIDGDIARFGLVSRQAYVTRPFQGATLFEFEADPEAEVVLRLNGLEERDTVRAIAAHSRLLWYRDDCVQLIRTTMGIEPETARRGDVYYQMACKAKRHRAIPESGYTATLTLADDEPLERETHYRVRVEQRNGQRAWSSPIWVRPAG